MRLMPSLFQKKNRDARRTKAGPGRRRALRVGIVAAAIGVTGAGGWYLTETGWVSERADAVQRAMIDATGRAGLRVSDVVVSGRTRTDAQQILAALDLEQGSPILGVDLAEARTRIESIAWISSAEIARRLPDVIFVRVIERQPLAIWQHDGQTALVDRAGEIIQRTDLEAFSEFPLIVGEGAPGEAARLLDLLQTYPTIANATEAAVRVSDRRWNLRLHEGIDVRLPEQNISMALDRLEAFQREHKIFDRDVVAVDLRVPDRLIVRVNPKAAIPAKAGGKDT